MILYTPCLCTVHQMFHLQQMYNHQLHEGVWSACVTALMSCYCGMSAADHKPYTNHKAVFQVLKNYSLLHSFLDIFQMAYYQFLFLPNPQSGLVMFVLKYNMLRFHIWCLTRHPEVSTDHG